MATLLIFAAVLVILVPLFIMGLLMGYDRGIRDSTEGGHW